MELPGTLHYTFTEWISIDGLQTHSGCISLHQPFGKTWTRRRFFITEEMIQIVKDIFTRRRRLTSTLNVATSTEFETLTRHRFTIFVAFAFIFLSEIRILLTYFTSHRCWITFVITSTIAVALVIVITFIRHFLWFFSFLITEKSQTEYPFRNRQIIMSLRIIFIWWLWL